MLILLEGSPYRLTAGFALQNMTWLIKLRGGHTERLVARFSRFPYRPEPCYGMPQHLPF